LSRGPHGAGKAVVRCDVDGDWEWMVLDTGSLFSILRDSERFRSYPTVGRIRFKSASGVPMGADTIMIKRLGLDQHLFTNVVMARVSGGLKLTGTLGLDVVGKYPFAVHFRDEAALYLRARAPERLLGGLTLYNSGLFTIPVFIGNLAGETVWDTGAELTAVDQSYVAAHPELFKLGGIVGGVMDGNDQPVAARLVKIRRLEVGGRTFRNVSALAVDLQTIHEGTSEKVPLVIGFNVIRRTDWYFDLGTRRWSIR
jgi:hypothetical protein